MPRTRTNERSTRFLTPQQLRDRWGGVSHMLNHLNNSTGGERPQPSSPLVEEIPKKTGVRLAVYHAA
jgi:hypothetical protein